MYKVRWAGLEWERKKKADAEALANNFLHTGIGKETRKAKDIIYKV